MIRSLIAPVAALALILACIISTGVAQVPTAPHDCSLCGGSAMLSCDGCKETGSVDWPCLDCDATGSVTCKECDPESTANAKPDVEPSPFEKRKLDELLELLKKAGVDTSQVGSGGREEHKGKPLKPGKRDCINRFCFEGTIRWDNGKKNVCKFCGQTGIIDCKSCENAKRTCPGCLGKRSTPIGCPHCGGAKKVPCPGCKVATPDDRCALCSGKSGHPCLRCAEKNHGPAACRPCIATGTVRCVECTGTGRAPCMKCGCSGKVRVTLVDQNTRQTSDGGTKSCEACEGAGLIKCDCRKGMRICEGCGGTKTVKDPCKGRVACVCGLDFPGAGWERLGDMASTRNRPDIARRMFEHARSKIQTGAVGDAKAEAANKKRSSRIDKKLAALPKP